MARLRMVGSGCAAFNQPGCCQADVVVDQNHVGNCHGRICYFGNTEYGTFSMINGSMHHSLKAMWIILLLSVCILTFWACSQKSRDDDYLIRVGTSTVSVAEFKHAVEASSEEAFPGEQAISPSALNDLRVRVLNQMTEELIITEHAKQVGIQVTDQELEASIAAVKADYPDDTFEKTLLENAISFQAWKRKMATRLLIDKVIDKELVDKVEITSEDVTAYFRAHFPSGVPEGEGVDQINQRIVQHLRQQKAEEMYQNWIETLRKNFPVDVHQDRWNRLIELSS